MRIRKIYQGQVPENAIMNGFSSSDTSTYACAYLNGTVLYNNTSGTSGSITLSDDISNYRFIEIYTMTNNNVCMFGNKYAVNLISNKVITVLNYENSHVRYADYTIGTNTLTIGSAYGYVELLTNTRLTDKNYLKIVKVMGYK